MRTKLVGLALAVVLVPARASATDVYSPMMFVPANIVLRCSATNVGTTPLKEFRIETIDQGGVLGSAGWGTDLMPGRSQLLFGSSGTERNLRCHWSFKGSAKKIRAAICVDLLGCLPGS